MRHRFIRGAALVAVLVVCGVAPAAAQTFGVIDARTGRNPQGKTWSSGLTCPPVAAPVGGAGAIYTCATDGTIYTWDGAAWDAAGGGGGALDITTGDTGLPGAPDGGGTQVLLTATVGNVWAVTMRNDLVADPQAMFGMYHGDGGKGEIWESDGSAWTGILMNSEAGEIVINPSGSGGTDGISARADRLRFNASMSAETVGVYAVNTSNTAESAAELAASTTGDNATGDALITLSVHEDGMDFAEAKLRVVGDEGDTPTTRFEFPGAALFDLTGDVVATYNFNNAGGNSGIHVFNTSTAADASAGWEAWTTSDTATGPTYMSLGVHAGGDDVAEFIILIAGDSGNDTPPTTFLFPGTAQFTTTDFRVSALTSTGAATGKKVVCVDTATGQLYASSTGVDCSN